MESYNKVSCNFLQLVTSVKVLSCECREFLENTYFVEHPVGLLLKLYSIDDVYLTYLRLIFYFYTLENLLFFMFSESIEMEYWHSMC